MEIQGCVFGFRDTFQEPVCIKKNLAGSNFYSVDLNTHD